MCKNYRGNIGQGYAAESSQIDKIFEWHRYISPLLLEWILVRFAGVVTGNFQGVTVLFHLSIPVRFRSCMFVVKTL
jgi:hypothetical protein